MLSWYALNSKPHREKLVQASLAARGIEVYLPLWYQPKLASAAYFPSYLFAHADLGEIGISGLFYTPGLRRIVFCGDQPVQVAQNVIDGIKTQMDYLEKSVTDPFGRTLVQGDRVVITGGVFEGYEAIFDRGLSSMDRVRVLIDFLQKRTPMNIEREFVQKKQLKGAPFLRRHSRP